MSSRASSQGWLNGYSCEGCTLMIPSGYPCYIVARGFLDDLVTAVEYMAEHWHEHCLDPFLLFVGIVPGDTVAVTLSQA